MNYVVNLLILVVAVSVVVWGVVRPRYQARRRADPPSWASPPDYVPRLWIRSPFSEWIWKSPKRMFWWMVLWPATALIAGVLLVVDNSDLGGIVVLGGLISGARAAVCAPRAWRAARNAAKQPVGVPEWINCDRKTVGAPLRANLDAVHAWGRRVRASARRRATPLGAEQTRPRRKRKQRPPAPNSTWTIRYALTALVLILVLGVAEGLLVSLWVPRGPARTGLAGILLDLTMLASLAPLYRRRRFRAGALGLRRAPAGASVGWVLLAVIVIGLTNLVWLQGVLGFPKPDSLGISLHGSTSGLVLAGVFIAFLAPVTEEIFFRGMLYRALRNRLSVPRAAVIGGVVFALVHGLSYPLDTLPPRLVFGIIACLLYERTGSLLPGIALHMIIDAGGLETAITGHNRIVLPAFALFGVALLLYAGIRLLLVPRELPSTPTAQRPSY